MKKMVNAAADIPHDWSSPTTLPPRFRPTLMNRIVNAAADIPHDWIISEKSRATAGDVPNANVITGNATAPPPSDVIPGNK